MSAFFRAAMTALLAVVLTGCLVPVPHRWDDDDDHRHYRGRDRDRDHDRGDYRRWDRDRGDRYDRYDRYDRRDGRR
jgi:hypothetical protein